MQVINKTNTYPRSSRLYLYCNAADYCDSFSTNCKNDSSIEDITSKVFALPPWVGWLIRTRDYLVAPFGLRTSPEISGQNSRQHGSDKTNAPFALLETSPCEIIMHEKDVHLNFWVSVLYQENKIHLTTALVYNNKWGRLYFAAVKPFHSLIIRRSLMSLNSKLS
jgi:hypothetical protein